MLAHPFTRKLLTWYRKNARELPWRENKDPYRIWISEIMLQQTTVKAVIPYYHRWMKALPDINSVARMSEQKILKLWQGLGYYNRARNIRKCAQIVVKEHGGAWLNDPQVIRKLPGFGEYTTGAVLSIAFDRRIHIIDGNVRRVVMRLNGIEGEAKPDKDVQIKEFLEATLPKRNCGDFNQALMELGALICRNRQPVCASCPVRELCSAFKNGRQEVIPQPKKTEIKQVHAAIGVICHKNKYFIQQRPQKGLFAGLWEFPGGKIEKGETARKALQREIQEEIGVEISEARHFSDVVHYYTQFKANLNVWICQTKNHPEVRPDRRWVTLREFAKYPMPSGTARIVEQLRQKTS